MKLHGEEMSLEGHKVEVYSELSVGSKKFYVKPEMKEYGALSKVVCGASGEQFDVSTFSVGLEDA